jgi:hypothetical protein
MTISRSVLLSNSNVRNVVKKNQNTYFTFSNVFLTSYGLRDNVEKYCGLSEIADGGMLNARLVRVHARKHTPLTVGPNPPTHTHTYARKHLPMPPPPPPHTHRNISYFLLFHSLNLPLAFRTWLLITGQERCFKSFQTSHIKIFFFNASIIQANWRNSVMASRLQNEDQRNCGSITGSKNQVFSFPLRPDRINDYWGLKLPGSGPGDALPSVCSDVKSQWNYQPFRSTST